MERFKYRLYMYNSMMEIKAITKKWGNSLGILIPKEAVDKSNLKANEEIKILIGKSRATKVRDVFGSLKFKKSTEQLMGEIDKDLDIAF